MSYRITFYCNDERIYKTSVYVPYLSRTYSRTYGDSSLGDYEEFSVSGIQGSATFSVEPESGCKFYRWVYRIGSTDATKQYSYDADFAYTGEQDIFIRAEGKTDGSETPWRPVSGFDLGYVDYDAKTDHLFYYDMGEKVDELGEYQVHHGQVLFSRSGYAHIYSSCSIDVIGFLSEGPDSSLDWSGPASVLASDDNSGDSEDIGNYGDFGNFDIRCYVEADKPYYLFVRSASGTETGFVRVTAEVPWALKASNYGTLQGSNAEDIYVSPFTMCRRAVKFNKSGKVTISTAGSLGVKGWLNTSTEWWHSSPVDEGVAGANIDFNNFSLTATVKAGQQYYIWLKNLEVTSYGTVTLSVSDIEEEEQPAVAKWDWNKSNGSASDSETKDAYWAAEFKGATTDFSHKVWNDMCRKVKEIREAIGEVWNEYYATYAETLMTAPGADGYYELTAKMYNSLRYNVGSLYGTGISEVKAGYDVKGSHFTVLVARMNDWIDSL